MRALFTGRGTSGSWQIRGQQLAGAIDGATALGGASAGDILRHGADLVVLVKRPNPGQVAAIRDSGAVFVWDVVDAYPQPQASKWTREDGIKWFRKTFNAYRPDAVVWPSQQMQDDCAGHDVPGIVLYHHHRPEIVVEPLREQVRTVGYEGSPRYIARWGGVIRRECKGRGWRFVVGADLVGCDLAVAFRDREWSGYVPENWKSNVKLANCHGAGVPFIGGFEASYLETGTGDELYVDRHSDLSSVFDHVADVEVRRRTRRAFLDAAYTLNDAASDYERFLRTLV